MNKTQVAKRIVKEILASQFFKQFNRFDVHYSNMRVYGRVTTIPGGETVTMIQDIFIEDRYQQKGIFTALVNELKATLKHPVYVQCVGNKGWESALQRSPDWHHVNGNDYISY